MLPINFCETINDKDDSADYPFMMEESTNLIIFLKIPTFLKKFYS